MSNTYKSWLKALSGGQREEFLDRLVKVYEHLLSPASSEGEKLEWTKGVTEKVLREMDERAKVQKENPHD